MSDIEKRIHMLREAADLLGHQSVQMTKSVYDRNIRIVQPLK